MTVNVRRAAPADAALLAALAARTFHDTFASTNTAEDMARFLASTYGVEQQSAELADPDVTSLLAEVDGDVAGYAQVRTGQTPDCVRGDAAVELWRFYVDRPWHGRGVARALMTAVEDDARRRDARTLWLGVWEHNERAKAFYAKYGFADVGSHVFLLGDDAQIDRILARPLATGAGTKEKG